VNAVFFSQGDFIVNREEKKFVLRLPEQRGDVMIEYSEVSPNVFNLYHTETPPAEGGKGLAGILSTKTFDWLKANNVKAIPTCSYLVRERQTCYDHDTIKSVHENLLVVLRPSSQGCIREETPRIRHCRA
jgi:predicted GNAT family acetyltransferase